MVSWSRIARRSRVPLGFVLAALYLWLANPLAISLLFGSLFVVPGLLIRALASGHVEKNQRLATTGPYAYTRNPLYLGSFIMASGFALAARSFWIAAILVVMFVAIYLPVIRAEEAFLAQHFPEFAEYARRVPRLAPNPAPPGKQHWAFSWDLYKKHREYNATLGAVAIMAALVIKLLWLSP
ncbi:MAG: methyltransferase family protein [Terriglobales bacterium]